jgi:type II protein arginine methyltransferase
MPSQELGYSSPPTLRLVESLADRSPAVIPSAAEDRIRLAALQATANELRSLATATQDSAAALLARSPSASERSRDAALRTVPRWHFAMLNDRDRNDAFALALGQRIEPGSHVLDIGAGTGLLAMMAVRAGAARVTTCEANPVIAEIARQVVEAHGLSDAIKVVPKLSTDLVVGQDMPDRADLVVSEIVDCGLIGESLLPAIRHARTHLLADGGQMIPGGGRLIGCLVESEAIESLNRVSTAGGYDVSLLNRFATPGHFPVRLMTWPHRLLSEPVELLRFDLANDSLEDGRRRVALSPSEDGTAHGVVAWFELDLGAGVIVRNPPQALTHWMQAFIPLPHHVPVTADDPLDIDLRWHQERLTARACVTVQNGKANQ